MRRLDFVVIGAHKSGTTALFQYLRQHPQIFLPPEKEIAFFSNEDWFVKGWDPFARQFFSQAQPDQLIGTVTPQYMAYPQVPERLFDLMPEIKLIALLRNPIDRAQSHYRMAVRTGHEQRSFEQAVAQCLKVSASADYLSLGEYGRILEPYARTFGRDKLLVAFTEQLECQPEVLFWDLCGFLGIESTFVPPNLGQRYHAGGTRQRWPWLLPALKAMRPVWILWQKIPEQHKGDLRLWYHTQVNVAAEPAPELCSEMRRKLADHFRDDVKKLESLISQRVPWEEFRSVAGGLA